MRVENRRFYVEKMGEIVTDRLEENFREMEIVLEGEFVDTGAGATLVPGDVLYVPAGGWNFPLLLSRRERSFSSVPQIHQILAAILL